MGAWTAFRIARRHRVRLLHARSHVGAAIALPLRILLGLPFLFDVRGLLPDEYADAGHWRRGGLKYRLGKAMERVFFRRARQVVVLTDTTRDDLVRMEPAVAARASDLTVIPCCVELPAYRPDDGARARERTARGWDGRRVLMFVGKLGLWSLDAEIARFFAVAHRTDARVFLQVLTPEHRRAPAEDPRDRGRAGGRLRHRRRGPARRAGGAARGRRRPASRPGVLRAPLVVTRPSSGNTWPPACPWSRRRGIGDCDRMLGGGRGVLLEALTDEALRRGHGATLDALLDDPDDRRALSRLRRGRAVDGARRRPALRIGLRADAGGRGALVTRGATP